MKSTKRIITLLLSVIMLAGTFSTAVSAEAWWTWDKQHVTRHPRKVEGEIPYPIAGQAFQSNDRQGSAVTDLYYYDVVSERENHRLYSYVSFRYACFWKGGTLKSPKNKMYSGVFEAGETYYIDIEFDDQGSTAVSFNNDTKFYINGIEGYVCYKSGTDILGRKHSARFGFTVPTEYISETDIQVEQPRDGQWPTNRVYHKDDYKASVSWFDLTEGYYMDSERIKNKTFVKGRTYDAVVTLSPVGVNFTDDLVVRINGEIATRKDEDNLIFRRSFRASDFGTDHVLRNLYADFTHPEVGLTPNQLTVSSTGSAYTASLVRCEEVLNNGQTLPMSGTEKFEYGKTYNVFVGFELAGGNSFNEPASEVIIGGKSATGRAQVNNALLVYRQYRLGLEDASFYIFPPTVGKTMGETLYVYGESDSFDVSITRWRYGEDLYSYDIDAYTVFKSNDKYAMYFTLKPKNGLALALGNDMNVTVNGIKARCVNRKDNTFICTFVPLETVPGELTATVDAPKEYNAPYNTASTPSKEYSAEVVSWYDGGTPESPGKEMKSYDGFEKGKTYIATVAFKPEYRYTLSVRKTAKINGADAVLLGLQNDGTYLFNTSVVAVEAPQVPDELEVTFIPPMEKTNPTYGDSSLSYLSDNYTASIEGWYLGGTLDDPGTEVKASERLQSDKTYIVRLELTHAEGYKFGKNNKLKVNGKYVNYYGRDPRTDTISFTFEVTPVEYPPIMVARAKKEIPKPYQYSFTGSVAEESGYYTEDLGWSIWNEETQTYDAHSGKFEPGKTYYFNVKFKTLNKGEFSEETVCLVNGEKAETVSVTNTTIIARYAVTYPPLINEVDLKINVPTGGESPDFSPECLGSDYYVNYVNWRNQLGTVEIDDKFDITQPYGFEISLTTNSSQELFGTVKATVNGEEQQVLYTSDRTNIIIRGNINGGRVAPAAPKLVHDKQRAEPGDIVTFTYISGAIKNLDTVYMEMDLEYFDFIPNSLIYPYAIKNNVDTKESYISDNGSLVVLFNEAITTNTQMELFSFQARVRENVPNSVSAAYEVYLTVDSYFEDESEALAIGCGYRISGDIIGDTSADGSVTVELMQGDLVLRGYSFTDSYSFSDVTPGTYTLRAGIDGKVIREYTVTVSGSDITQDVVLSLACDVNGDGKLNTSDVVIYLRYIAGWGGLKFDIGVADANGDGKYNTTDVVLMLRYIAGWSITLGGK